MRAHPAGSRSAPDLPVHRWRPSRRTAPARTFSSGTRNRSENPPGSMFVREVRRTEGVVAPPADGAGVARYVVVDEDPVARRTDPRPRFRSPNDPDRFVADDAGGLGSSPGASRGPCRRPRRPRGGRPLRPRTEPGSGRSSTARPCGVERRRPSSRRRAAMMDASRISTPSSISSARTTRGGMKRMEDLPQGSRTRPRRYDSSTIRSFSFTVGVLSDRRLRRTPSRS